MTPYIDQLCVAAGKQGAVKIHNRRISVFHAENHDHELLDFETFEDKCDWAKPINELARRQRYRDSA